MARVKAKGGFFAATETLPYQPKHPRLGQLLDDSCVAACVLMLLRDQGQEEVYEALLRTALNIRGEGGFISDVPLVLRQFGSQLNYLYRDDLSLFDLEAATLKGSALVEVRFQDRRGSHALLVDGVEGEAYVLIRDPLPRGEGAAYKVSLETFLAFWLSEKIGLGRGVAVE